MTNLNTPQSQDGSTKETQETKHDDNTSTPIAPSKQNNHTNHGNHHPCCKGKPAKWWHRIDWSQVVLDGLLLIVGIKLACIYSGQLREMIESNRISRESLMSVQRPFVGFKGIDASNFIRQPNSTDRIANFSAVWENTGATPAIDAFQYFNVNWLTDKELESFAFAEDRNLKFSSGIVGARTTILSAPRRYTENQVTHPRIGTSMVLWGWIAYKDIFPKTDFHLTEFCVRLTSGSVESNPQNPTEKRYHLGFSGCEAHNCFDRECSDYGNIIGMVGK